MKTFKLRPPLAEGDVNRLRAGDLVSVTGKIVTARDKAYARALEFLRARKRLPLDLRGAIVYHCGPLAKRTRGGWHIISAGPTTSARLDWAQTNFVRRAGIRALVGKGGVGEEVAAQLARLGCVYLAFTGGAGVLAARAVAKVEKLFWEDLGPAEALWVLRVNNFGPLVVAVDTKGNDLCLHRCSEKRAY